MVKLFGHALKLKLTLLCIYIIPGKKVGILATGCRRFVAKSDATRQQKRRKMAKNDAKRHKMT